VNITSNVEELSREDLIAVMHRDRLVKAELSQRVGALVAENVELFALVRELQGELDAVRQSATAATNGDDG
jgi:cell division protein FtsB